MEHTVKLTDKERLFCLFYRRLGNSREAALQAGYPAGRAGQEGLRLLAEERIASYLESLGREEQALLGEKALRGLERLAFSPINDSVTLLLEPEPEGMRVDQLDLFMVSEIRRPKGGELEIRFYDRLKALEALAALAGAGREGAAEASFYTALEKSLPQQPPGEDEAHAF
ncbi:terminase small subunit [Oscillospiraceae bacterium MB08-C2-2]|nr:terminase small subunit [Oscillospiraceae bacterium MB08-C2-2]